MTSPLWLYLFGYALFSLPAAASWQNIPFEQCAIPTESSATMCPIKTQKIAIPTIKRLLTKKETAMQPAVVNKVLHSLACAEKKAMEHNHIVTVIDFSLPSNKKRLWVFDLNKNTLLFHTYVSHGIRSGKLNASYFSNINNSKASSIGVFKAAQSYYGRYGLALKLEGLEKGINHNAFNRAIVMHGGWYVDEKFIKKYGRAGRSWGCPALPPKLNKAIINTIKDGALFIAYFPSEQWYTQSGYLNCQSYSSIPLKSTNLTPLSAPPENRDPILYVAKNNNRLREENEPIIAMSADDYQRLFHRAVPLTRMLRRPINDAHYIALNGEEFAAAIDSATAKDATNRSAYKDKIKFIIPVIKRSRGYYATEMRMLNLGTIETLRSHDNAKNDHAEYTLRIKNKPDLHVKSTTQFIRWLGL